MNSHTHNDYPFGMIMPQASPDSLLFSSSFDAGTDGWVIYNAGTLQNDNGRLKFLGTVPWSTPKKDLQLKTGKQYRVRFTIDMGNCTELHLPIYKADITSFETLSGVGLSITASGTYEGTFTATSNSMMMLFEMIPGVNPPPDSTGYYWLDNISIEEVKPADTTHVGKGDYRYGFNGKENDNDIENGIQDYGMRIYDGRLGRFLSVDPITKKYPELTPYQFASNTPIQAIDIDGLEAFFVHGTWSDSRTWSALKNENYAAINNATGNKTDFTFDWKYNNIKGANLDAARQRAGRQLADRIMQIHKLHLDEPITIVGHSHGGNVGIIATNILAKKGYQVNYLITINTPAREYQLSRQAQRSTLHFNIYDSYDPIQNHGGNTITILPLLNGRKGTGEFGSAGRVFDNAKNFDVYRKDAWYNPRGLTQFFDFGNDVHNSHNKPQLWSGWLYNRIQGDKWYNSYQQQQSQAYEKRSQDPSYNPTDNTMVSNPPPALPTQKKE